jgi:hypothetical protein
MKKVYARFNKDKYLLLSELGSKLNLSFSSHLVLGNKLIALDGKSKILLVSEPGNELSQPFIVELDKVSAVSVRKSYASIGPGELKSKGFEEFLKRIDLQFEYHDKNKTIALSFYDSETDDLQDIPRLDKNAKNWQLILSKMAASNVKREIENKSRFSLA